MKALPLREVMGCIFGAGGGERSIYGRCGHEASFNQSMNKARITKLVGLTHGRAEITKRGKGVMAKMVHEWVAASGKRRVACQLLVGIGKSGRQAIGLE